MRSSLRAHRYAQPAMTLMQTKDMVETCKIDSREHNKNKMQCVSPQMGIKTRNIKYKQNKTSVDLPEVKCQERGGIASIRL